VLEALCAVADNVSTSYTICRNKGRNAIAPLNSEEVTMAEKSKQPKEPKKKPQKTMMEKRKEKREKEATKHEE
jgi:hypothetical protein